MLNQQANDVKHRSFVITVQSTYNEVGYDEKSIILNRLLIPINQLEYISSLVTWKFGCNEKIACPSKISILVDQTVYSSKTLVNIILFYYYIHSYKMS